MTIRSQDTNQQGNWVTVVRSNLRKGLSCRTIPSTRTMIARSRCLRTTLRSPDRSSLTHSRDRSLSKVRISRTTRLSSRTDPSSRTARSNSPGQHSNPADPDLSTARSRVRRRAGLPRTTGLRARFGSEHRVVQFTGAAAAGLRPRFRGFLAADSVRALHVHVDSCRGDPHRLDRPTHHLLGEEGRIAIHP